MIQLTPSSSRQHSTVELVLRGFILSVILLLVIAVSISFGVQIGKKQTLQSQTPLVSPTVVPSYTQVTDIPTQTTPSPSTSDRKVFENSDFGFSFSYSSRFSLQKTSSENQPYVTLGTITAPDNEYVLVTVINNIDIYANSNVTDVAKREVMDGGFLYTVTPLKVAQYSAALTTINEPDASSFTITIKHPQNNLYVVLQISKDFPISEKDKLLSSFKFNPIPTSQAKSVKLFFHDSKLDPNLNSCEANNFIEKNMPTGSTPIKDTLEALIKNSVFEQNSKFKLESLNLKSDGTLVLKFPSIGGFTTGGSCRIGIMTSQIEKTALQFPEVKRVSFEPAVFQP